MYKYVKEVEIEMRVEHVQKTALLGIGTWILSVLVQRPESPLAVAGAAAGKTTVQAQVLRVFGGNVRAYCLSPIASLYGEKRRSVQVVFSVA